MSDLPSELLAQAGFDWLYGGPTRRSSTCRNRLCPPTERP